MADKDLAPIQITIRVEVGGFIIVAHNKDYELLRMSRGDVNQIRKVVDELTIRMESDRQLKEAATMTAPEHNSRITSMSYDIDEAAQLVETYDYNGEVAVRQINVKLWGEWRTVIIPKHSNWSIIDANNGNMVPMSDAEQADG